MTLILKFVLAIVIWLFIVTVGLACLLVPARISRYQAQHPFRYWETFYGSTARTRATGALFLAMAIAAAVSAIDSPRFKFSSIWEAVSSSAEVPAVPPAQKAAR